MGKPYNRPDGRGNAFPLWWLAPPLSPHSVVGLWMRSHGAMSIQESIERFILPPEQGEVRRSRIGGGERSEPIRRMLIMPYDTESKSRNADFISIALRAIHNPRPEGPSNLRTLRPIGPVHLKNPFPQPFYTTCRHQAAITLGTKSRQPSHRRCVQAPLRTIKNPLNCCLADFMVTQEGFEPPTP